MLEYYLDEPFAHAYAFTGGSDYDFFWRCRNDGRSFAWADDAHVFETTPPSRTTVGYVLRRKFRNGTEATRLERKFLGTLAGTLRRWCIGLGLIGLGIASLPLAALRGRRAIMASLIRAARGRWPPRRGIRPALRAIPLEHDPEKWIPVFGKDHAPPKC